jgi:alcohol dehydrogenase class IV
VKDLTMDKKRKALIAEMALADPSTGSNPVKLTKKALAGILDNTIAGVL